ncbi:uncharacterized protein LOC126788145 [Argentina anserina]|uniref:uncharacterized protein LOC126788145 n=1 Tax=Argentina anserina TaxID=57926 RepID=UPI0021767231|nr:uncharacterized protein LOC126788145 [Potentilla anserina]
MQGLKRLTWSSISASSQILRPNETNKSLHLLPPSQHFLAQRISNRFLEFYKLANKAALEKEKARLADELNRGYFADMEELKKHGGKVSEANKILFPAMAAVKFPDLEVYYTDGNILKLPFRPTGNENVADANGSALPKASLLCLSFRASAQGMINSWSVPFVNAFSGSKDVQLFEVSFIDIWLLCQKPFKHLLLRIMKKPKHDDNKDAVKRHNVYSFGDHYYFRKELKILNLVTGYVFLLDKFGRIRWQGSGVATKEEALSLLSCTSVLLEEK